MARENILEPTLEEWAEAYQAWLSASSELSFAVKSQFRDDEREDRTHVVSEIVEQLNNHELIVPSYVRFSPEEDNGSGMFDLWMVLKDMPPREDGFPDDVVLMLRHAWQPPEPLPTTISEENALIVHDGISQLFESSRGPLLIDLSNGLIIRTIGDGLSSQNFRSPPKMPVQSIQQ